MLIGCNVNSTACFLLLAAAITDSLLKYVCAMKIVICYIAILCRFGNSDLPRL